MALTQWVAGLHIQAKILDIGVLIETVLRPLASQAVLGRIRPLDHFRRVVEHSDAGDRTVFEARLAVDKLRCGNPIIAAERYSECDIECDMECAPAAAGEDGEARQIRSGNS